jgi:hypothetical protein
LEWKFVNNSTQVVDLVQLHSGGKVSSALKLALAYHSTPATSPTQVLAQQLQLPHIQSDPGGASPNTNSTNVSSVILECKPLGQCAVCTRHQYDANDTMGICSKTGLVETVLCNGTCVRCSRAD